MKKLDRLRKKGDKLEKKVQSTTGKKQDKTLKKAFKKEAKKKEQLTKLNKKYKKKAVKGLKKADGSPAKMKDMKKPGKRKDKYTTDSGTKVKVKIKRYKTESGKKQATVKVKTKTASGQKKKKVMSTGDRKFRDDGSIRMNNPQGYSSRKKAKKASPVQMTGKAYDNKEAYNKNLSASARLHYLENERSDDKSPMNMYGKKSPLEKELVGSHSPLNMNGKPKEKAMKSDTVRGFDNYNTGDYVSEDDFESKFKLKGNNSKNYPQLTVQDYSQVKEDKKGKYVVKTN